MIAWEPQPIATSEEKPTADGRSEPAAGVLYRLTVAFPTWAGAILAVYSIFLFKFSALKIRVK